MTTLVSYGAGTNSTAMIVEMVKREERYDFALFADTGGERPETYDYILTFNEWLASQGQPLILTVRKGGKEETLEENCLRMNMLPSIAYGFKGCSFKYKIEPQNKWANNNSECRATWNAGEKVTKCIGYDMDEPHRWFGKDWNDKKYFYRSPLIEWRMGREECVESIRSVGLPLPGKSACFFCPSSKKHEILELKRAHPILMQRALKMEANAKLETVKGLGRNFAWRDLVAADEAQLKMFPEGMETDCGCYEGSE